MSQRQRFIRKIIYACAIAALLLPLSWLSQPETRESSSPGGVLAQMRKEHQLSQAALGEIDPASETIKLATLGMRGVAANILWEKAHYYRKTEDWANLSATLEQIVKLQPNFVSVWVYQGWNLSYNISVEFDDYRDRYYWVIKGINFLKEGTTYNTQEPRLVAEIGETIGRKIGRADERVQFRRLFRDDDDFNGDLPRSQRDNWLVARTELLKAQQMVDEKGMPLRGKSPLLFYAQPPMCLISYSEALEEEGKFGEVAKDAWRRAAEAWTAYSNRDLPTTHSYTIRLNEKELFEERSKAAQAELARVTPEGLREQILAERVATLTEQEREVYDTPLEKRTSDQGEISLSVHVKTQVSHFDVADRITGPDRQIALKAAEEAMQADEVANAIDIERGIVNYDYWLLRCRVEPDDNTLEARKFIYDADQEFLASRLVKSAELYNKGWEKWRKVIDTYPNLLTDVNTTDELMESIKRYRSLLHQLDEKLPEPFVLQDVIDADLKFHGPRLGASPESATPPAGDKSPPVEGPGGQKSL